MEDTYLQAINWIPKPLRLFLVNVRSRSPQKIGKFLIFGCSYANIILHKECKTKTTKEIFCRNYINYVYFC